MVKLHNTHSRDKLICISVNTDSQTDPLYSKSLSFLKAKNSDLMNFVLLEEPETWTAHFGVDGWPALFVYGKDGKRSEAFNNYEDLQNELDKHFK